MAARLTVAEVLRLTLERQGLLRRTTGLQPAAAVERFGPLHATDHRTPYLSLLARIEDFAIADLDRAWFVERTLDRRAAMRGTLHLIPAARLADVVCVFGTARPEDHRGLRDARIAPAEAERFRRAVHAVIEGGGPLELAALKRSLPPAMRTRATEKTVLGRSVLAAIVRWMTEAGLLSLTAATEVRGGSLGAAGAARRRPMSASSRSSVVSRAACAQGPMFVSRAGTSKRTARQRMRTGRGGPACPRRAHGRPS